MLGLYCTNSRAQGCPPCDHLHREECIGKRFLAFPRANGNVCRPLPKVIPRPSRPERRGRGLPGPDLVGTESWDTDLASIQVGPGWGVGVVCAAGAWATERSILHLPIREGRGIGSEAAGVSKVEENTLVTGKRTRGGGGGGKAGYGGRYKTAMSFDFGLGKRKRPPDLGYSPTGLHARSATSPGRAKRWHRSFPMLTVIDARSVPSCLSPGRERFLRPPDRA